MHFNNSGLKKPNQWRIPWSLKERLGCISKKTVIKNEQVVIIRDKCLCYHDLYHIEIAQLDRIQIGKHQVSGIHGINTKILHKNFPIVEEYDGILDEIRVCFHEFMVYSSIYNTFKTIAWCFWLLSQGINPIAVMWQHYKTLKTHKEKFHTIFIIFLESTFVGDKININKSILIHLKLFFFLLSEH